ncbi:hypothetical protein [Halodesulfovibrio sp.]|jgi:hypothetical protein|uniref:plasmid mobilization protein n=1 Tax=Halodesulfovibrio sp. TaxID=1912772 RepID=UPI0025F89F6C|nr:hypothetical protein [Halodesulfovibrio sp.]MCT4625695.1 hypothetical protein [Halodesulfovibrio sp.]
MNQKKPQKVRKVCLKSYVTESESDRIVALAKQCGLSVSELVRRVALGQEVNTKVDKEAFLSLLKVNADLGRLGGLLKFALTAEARKVASHREIRELLHQIEDRQEEMRHLIRITEKAVLNRNSGGDAK